MCARVQHVGRERRDRDLAVGDAVQLGYAACSVAPHAWYKASLFVAESAVAESKADAKLDTRSTFQLAMFWLKAAAPENVFAMLVTLAVFHEPMSALKAVALWNMLTMLLARAVFHEPM